jgi:hypothetical protein
MTPRLAGDPIRDIVSWLGRISTLIFDVKIRSRLCRESNQPLGISLGYLKIIYISENTGKMMEQAYM